MSVIIWCMKKLSYKDFFDISTIVKQIHEYMPKFNESKFIEAFEFAASAHDGQLRKDGKTPYVVHPVMVVQILAQMHADEDVLIAGLLHDVPEDTEYTTDDVAKRFGNNVAFLVDGITKLSKVYYQDNMPAREVESLKKMFLHSTKDPRVILIKLADRLHNMRTLKYVRDDKQLRIARETLSIYVPIANLLGIQAIKTALEDLCFTYLFPEEYQKLTVKVNGFNKRHKRVVDKMISEIESKCKKDGLNVEVQERKKNLYSIYKKISESGKSIDDLEDRIALRIIVNEDSDCYTALGKMHDLYTPKHNRFRDYIASPKPNGYQSVHTAVFGPEGFLTELQIRSRKMQLEAEYGIAAHFFYNEKDKILNDKRSSWVSKIIEIDKSEFDDKDFLDDLKLDIFEDRIIVFDAKGTTVDLPAGASVIDFAYAIGGKSGDELKKAEINTNSVPITATLKSGDVVKLITSKEVSPELWWLSFVKTNFAKNKIKKHLKKISKQKKITLGYKALQKEFDISGLGLVEKISFKKLKKAMKEYIGENVNNLEEVLMLIGEGHFRSIDIVKAVQHSLKYDENIKVTLKIVADNRFGLLKDVYAVLYEHVSDITFLKAWTSRKQKEAYFTIKVSLSDVSKVARLFSELEQIQGINHVYRISNRALMTIWGLSFITATIWILHPLATSYFLKSDFFLENRIISEWILNSTLLLLFLSIFYLTTLVRKYFPIIRNKKRLWLIIFSIPSLAMTVLFMEMFYFELQLSWFTVLVEVALIYAYLTRNFMSFSKGTN
ncbi:(p)ppGpp synthetase [Candidatus Peregrinibacteria bacterium CG10_big_fil_rev_8_21_14_0_10_36_19]|nr:MAG: (p)ppGpp synthetase [Candidatus Peregrinibacteria bacterium CG10_big_fil_rev_8_21_14_0_10_36_19]